MIPALDSGFHTTRWTLVRQATGNSPAGQQALSDLLAACYEPVLAFLRSSGQEPDEAREAAHGFMAELLAKPNLGGAEPGKGRFRSYLLGALKHYLSRQRMRRNSQKRGGAAVAISLDAGTGTSPGVDPVDEQSLSPDREFDRQWALHILEQAMASLAGEWRVAGREGEFLQLQPFIGGGPAHGGLAALAEQRGENPATLRKTVSRLRQRFRYHVKAQITPTLASPDDADAEMRELLEALG
jgi:DNA-directed RNA polymerase specialized sigma24 family protein